MTSATLMMIPFALIFFAAGVSHMSEVFSPEDQSGTKCMTYYSDTAARLSSLFIWISSWGFAAYLISATL